MKGNPEEPRCGFSNAVCKILEMHGVLDASSVSGSKPLFVSFDVLSDDALRNAAKIYSDWPTFPQVFFDGDFVGGCDILLENHKSGQLIQDLAKIGFVSAIKP